jgi:hypothetical protein
MRGIVAPRAIFCLSLGAHSSVSALRQALPLQRGFPLLLETSTRGNGDTGRYPAGTWLSASFAIITIWLQIAKQDCLRLQRDAQKSVGYRMDEGLPLEYVSFGCPAR